MMLQHTKQKHHILVMQNEKIDKIVFVPDENFVFPETKMCFQFELLKKFSWLCYSPSEDAAYC